MADVRSRGTAPPAAAVGEPDALLATKVSIPRVRRDVVSRPRLLERLQERLAQELLLVCTPAGFGKTTLLAGWAHGARWPVAWLSLDADDNDPARSGATWSRPRIGCHLGIAEPVWRCSPAPAGPPARRWSPRCSTELAALPDELALVLDDYHLMESQQVHQAVAFLLAHLPSQLHVVIASRTDPPLPLARLRARGQLGEFRAADLRFTHQEAAVLLQDLWKLDLPAEAVASRRPSQSGSPNCTAARRPGASSTG